MIPTEICPMMGYSFIKFLKLNKIVKNTLAIKGKNNFQKMKNDIKNMINNHISIFVTMDMVQ